MLRADEFRMVGVDEILAFALRAVDTAGQITLNYFQRGAVVDYKADESPVTIADREAELSIRNSIRHQFPDHGILGEEHGTEGDQSRRWVIDPIDGTKSFVCGVPLYSVLLSYEEDGVPVVGVSHFPALGETVYAVKNGGAFWNGTQCHVSTKTDLKTATISTGSHKSLDTYGRLAGIISLAHRCQATRTWSDAYGHCLVATGRIEAMVDPVVSYHDLSAVSLIVKEAGGKFTNFSGEPGIFKEAISSNGLLHDEIVGAFSQ